MSVVLDASALLAFLGAEPGAERVAAHLNEGALMSAVNLAEVVSKLSERGMPLEAVRSAVGGLGLQLEVFDEASAYAAGDLRRLTQAQGLSLGDRACLALGIRVRSRVLTTDRAWDAIAAMPGLMVEQVR